MDAYPHKEIYLDNNATTHVLTEVCDSIVDALGVSFGNPSSVHSGGDRGRSHLRLARERVSHLIGCPDPEAILFAGSGTEANNVVLASHCKGAHPRIITTAVEHSSILKMAEHLAVARGAEVVALGVDARGHIDLGELAESLSVSTALASIQWVNNETGTILPIEKIGEICQSFGVPLHTDAAQAVGKLPVDVDALPIDFLTLTAHKFHGPQGVGAVWARDRGRLSPQIFGGPQEDGLRAGTENVPGIVGLG